MRSMSVMWKEDVLKKLIRLVLLFLAKDLILSRVKESTGKDVLDLEDLLETWFYAKPYGG